MTYEYWAADGGYRHYVETPYETEPVKALCGQKIGKGWRVVTDINVACRRCESRYVNRGGTPRTKDKKSVPFGSVFYGQPAKEAINLLIGMWEQLQDEGWENVAIDWEGGWGECYPEDHELQFRGSRPKTEKEINAEKARAAREKRERAEHKAKLEAKDREIYEKLKARFE